MTSRDNLQRVRVPVRLPAGEACTACIARFDQGVDSIVGIGSVEVGPGASELEVVYDPSVVTREQVVAQIERLGHEVGSAIAHTSWRVAGLDCPDCARTVDVSVSHLEGVFSASLNFASGVLFVEYDPAQDPRAEIERFVTGMGYGLERVGDAAGRPVSEFRVTGLDCPDCARGLADRIAALEGVESADIEFATARLRVGYDPDVVTPSQLADAVVAGGYGVEEHPVRGERGTLEPRAGRRGDTATWASGALVASGWLLGLLLGVADVSQAWRTLLPTLSYAAAIIVGGGMIVRRAVSSARARVLDMNVLMTIAVIGAALIGEWAEAAMVVFLFSVGGMLESRSLERTRRSIRDLMDLTPAIARVVRAGVESEISPADAVVGDRIVVRPGERLPLDGRIEDGFSAMDEAAITGESVPVDKGPGESVWAGTLNTYAPLIVEVTAPAEDTTLARVIFLVEEAQAQRAPFQRLVDRFTRWYTPAVTALAAVLAIGPPLAGVLVGTGTLGFDTSFSTWFYRALVLLVVSCPCALVISTPVAIVSAITRASRDGVLVKGGAFLEMAPRIRALAFDKTGTLTHGRPDVADVIALDGVDASTVLGLAGTLEGMSTHPIAGAVVRASERAGQSLSAVAKDVREVPGRGVTGMLDGRSAIIGSLAFAEESGFSVDGAREHVELVESEGRTALALGLGDRVVGIIAVADTPRDSAPGVVAHLKRLGFEAVTMLTGDNERVAGAVAQRMGLDSFDARLLPEQKVDAVSALQERYGTVAMVGDGINDAPALAVADLGIAMGAAGSDTALETADIALMSDDLNALPRFFELGRRTVANIRQNVVISVAIKVVVLVAAVFGFAPLWLAVLADTGVALLVILNGLRLLRPVS